jgi:hypothetical protein
MAYTITVRTESEALHVVTTLYSYLDRSRFTVGTVETAERPLKGLEVRLFSIRLKAKKRYCGNHPGPCRLTGRKHARHRFLEGLDWCSFNDMVNDLLDGLGMEADVRSSTCRVRKGGQRRIAYGMSVGPFGHAGWEPDGDVTEYLDCRLKEAPATEYPAGTPGISGWQVWHTEGTAEAA